ncbi:hypothetical protein WN51_03896 [Melipona quadrifasciata]|uniref:Uncharacterized protein n=1 Tax=Melipona quadrifasciata TaxID=166423 RepID=A0A0M8ZPE3_9HYME|nr:hypothetical protein WN51_03896 [Melipona quadrifasciata]
MKTWDENLVAGETAENEERLQKGMETNFVELSKREKNNRGATLDKANKALSNILYSKSGCARTSLEYSSNRLFIALWPNYLEAKPTLGFDGMIEIWKLRNPRRLSGTQTKPPEEPFAWMNAFKLVNHRANGRFPRVTVAGIGWTLLTGISTSTGPFWARPIKTQGPKAKVQIERLSRVGKLARLTALRGWEWLQPGVQGTVVKLSAVFTCRNVVALYSYGTVTSLRKVRPRSHELAEKGALKSQKHLHRELTVNNTRLTSGAINRHENDAILCRNGRTIQHATFPNAAIRNLKWEKTTAAPISPFRSEQRVQDVSAFLARAQVQLPLIIPPGIIHSLFKVFKTSAQVLIQEYVQDKDLVYPVRK